MAALLLPLTTRCWPISLRRFGVQRTIQFIRAGICQSRGCSAVESRSRSRRRQAEITITGYSIWCRESFCSNTQPKIFPTTTRSCSTVRERITNAKSLAALGVPPEKIRYVDSRERFQIASAVFPSMDINVIAPWKVHGLRNLPFSGKLNQHRRLYLSRARAAVRRIANENEISEVLRHWNFEIIEAENLSWPEQADLFAGASVIVGPHGAALANIVFCKPGTRVVEISTRAGYHDWYWQLAAVAGLSYEVLEAQRSGSFSGPYENADMIVSRENVEQIGRASCRERVS